jgi:protocatechuate 3,4-dioxygenase beta subunit
VADRPDMATPPLTRRHILRWLGAGGLAAFVTACAKGTDRGTGAWPRPSSTTTTSVFSGNTAEPPARTAACVLTPEQTEGPYYISGEAVRRDITEGTPGTPLRLALTVVDATSCTPVPDAIVEVWHADASGNYSGFGSSRVEPSSSRTFLRGAQVTDGRGYAEFVTIYPGWYRGRATHIHLKVHAGGKAVHTGQLYFDEATTDAVYATSAYRGHTGRRTRNAADGIYRNGGARSMLALSRDGAGSGYVGTITLGVRT